VRPPDYLNKKECSHFYRFCKKLGTRATEQDAPRLVLLARLAADWPRVHINISSRFFSRMPKSCQPKNDTAGRARA
jgi:hypothetical protein